MDTKKAKQAITLAIDTLGHRGRFTINDVADEAMRLVKYESLSITDQRAAVRELLKSESRIQVTTPLTEELRKEVLEHLPDELWPVFEKLGRTITVAPGGVRVLSVMATIQDLDDALRMMDALRDTVESGRQSILEARDLLRARGLTSIRELIGEKATAA